MGVFLVTKAQVSKIVYQLLALTRVSKILPKLMHIVVPSLEYFYVFIWTLFVKSRYTEIIQGTILSEMPLVSCVRRTRNAIHSVVS